MARWSAALCLLAGLFAGDFGADAITVPIQGHRRSGKWWETLGGVLQKQRRAGIVDLQNAVDLQYFTNITLGGQQFRVLVDSGSADLWVAGDVPGSNSTTHNATINYNDGSVSGRIQTATLGIEGYTISNQAYISQEVTESYPEGEGILGLGPSRLSSVLAALGTPKGDPPLDRLFQEVTSLPSYISILLGRSNDPDSPIPGQLTIGEVLSDYGDVTSSPQLPIERVDWNQHWMVALDKGGITGPDGKPIKASVDKQLKVIFDSGYTLPQVPKSVADAIYARVPNATYVNISAADTPVWTLPCDVELNITFTFAGVSYPVHPLDTVMDDLRGPPDSSGQPTCVGSFQPMSSTQPYDIVLGMAFLRNAYILMNFGDFVDGSTEQVGDPFVQLHALTDPVEAHGDFVQQRLGGVDTTGLQTLLPATEEDTSAGVKAPGRMPYLPWIIVASVLGGLLVAFLVAYVFIWRRGRKYRRVHENAPSGLEEGKRSLSPSNEKPPEIAMADKAFGPNSSKADTDTLSRKVDTDELIWGHRSRKPKGILAVTRESSAASSTEQLLPGTASSSTSHETSEESAPLASDDKPLPNPYADASLPPTPLANSMEDRPLPNPYADAPARTSPAAKNDRPLPLTDVRRTPSPAPAMRNATLPPPAPAPTNATQPLQTKRARPLPDPRAYTPRVADVFDVSRARTSSIYKLPPLQFSSADLAGPHAGARPPPAS